MIVYGKVTHDIFHSADGLYHIFNIRRHGGQPLVATYTGDAPPKPLKTVEYEFHGEEAVHPKYGKQFAVTSYCRSTVKGESPALNYRLKRLDQTAAHHMRDL
jgi:hypothetical protein